MIKRRRRYTGARGRGGLIRLITGDPVGRGTSRVIRRRGARGRDRVKFEVESEVAREIFAVIYLAISFLVLEYT